MQSSTCISSINISSLCIVLLSLLRQRFCAIQSGISAILKVNFLLLSPLLDPLMSGSHCQNALPIAIDPNLFIVTSSLEDEELSFYHRRVRMTATVDLSRVGTHVFWGFTPRSSSGGHREDDGNNEGSLRALMRRTWSSWRTLRTSLRLM